MSRIHLFALACVACSVLTPLQASAQDLDGAAKALDLISKFAVSICPDVSTKGGTSSVELSGSAKAEVSKLIKQLADLKVEGAAKYQTTEYEGVLQKDLADALKDSATCRQKISQDLSDKLIPKPKVSVENGCQVSGSVFDRTSHAAIAGAIIDAYTFQPLASIRESRVVASHIAISGPDGSFSGDCRGIAQSSFPLRLAVRRVPSGGTEFMPSRIDFNDVQSKVNLPLASP